MSDSDTPPSTRTTLAELRAKVRRAADLEEAARVEGVVKPVDSGSKAQKSDDDDPEQGTNAALATVRVRNQTLKTKNRKQDIKLRKRLVFWALVFVGGQLFFSNLFFLIYLLNNKSNPSPQIMTAWLGASVVEVIGILLVIARNLFPVKKSAGQTTQASE